jgi:hypothetical protein
VKIVRLFSPQRHRGHGSPGKNFGMTRAVHVHEHVNVHVYVYVDVNVVVSVIGSCSLNCGSAVP